MPHHPGPHGTTFSAECLGYWSGALSHTCKGLSLAWGSKGEWGMHSQCEGSQTVRSRKGGMAVWCRGHASGAVFKSVEAGGDGRVVSA